MVGPWLQETGWFGFAIDVQANIAKRQSKGRKDPVKVNYLQLFCSLLLMSDKLSFD